MVNSGVASSLGDGPYRRGFPKRLGTRAPCPSRLGLALLAALLISGCPRRFDPRADEIRTKNSDAEVAYRRIHTLLQKGDPRAAGDEAARFIERYGEDPLVPQAILLRARAALLEKDAEKARDLLMPLAYPPPGQVSQVTPRAQFLLGLALYRLGDFAHAKGLLRQFSDQIVDSEDGTELHAVLADLARRNGEAAEAIKEYERFYQGRGVTEVERAYIREQVAALLPTLPPDAQDPWRRRFSLEGGIKGPPGQSIGLILPLSGRDRALGERVLRGALFAADLFPGETQEGGVGARADIRVRDSASSAERAAQAVHELFAEGVLALIASPLTAEASAIAKEAGRLGLPVLDVCPPASSEAPADRALRFSLMRDNGSRLRELIRHAQKQGARTLAILAPDTEYGRAMTRIAVSELTGKVPRVVAQLTFQDGATTFTAQIRQLLGLRPHALLLPVSAGQLELIASQLAASGLTMTRNVPVPGGAQRGTVSLILSTAEGLSERLMRNAGRYLEGAVLSPIHAGLVPVEDPAMSRFGAGYRQRFGEEPSALDALGHDAMLLFRNACGAECTTQTLIARLPRVSLSGATGKLALSDAGARGGSPLLLRVEEGGLKLLQ